MISFRRLNTNDFQLIFDWLNNSHVKQFWYPDSSFSFGEICNKYNKKIIEKKNDMFIFTYKDKEIGYLQSYEIFDKACFKQSKRMVGIDLFIGEIAYTYKGIGPLVIKDYIDNHVPKNFEIIGIDPAVSNPSAIHAYQKVGFKHVNTEYNSHEKTELFYMIFDRTK